MSAAKHTPGPWQAKRHRSTHDSFNVYAPDPSEHASDGDLTIIAEYLTEGNAKLIAAAPALADEHERAVQLLAHIIEFRHYQTDQDTPSEVLGRIEEEANEVAKLIGYDGYTSASLRAAGRLP